MVRYIQFVGWAASGVGLVDGPRNNGDIPTSIVATPFQSTSFGTIEHFIIRTHSLQSGPPYQILCLRIVVGRCRASSICLPKSHGHSIALDGMGGIQAPQCCIQRVFLLFGNKKVGKSADPSERGASY